MAYISGIIMGKTITVSYHKTPCYNIELQKDFRLLPEKLKELGYGKNRACIVTETVVEKFYLEEVKSLLSPMFALCTSFVFEEGESNKNTDTVGKLYNHLIQNSFDRKDVLIALGGGVTGDLTGFAAATYLRGIDFVQVPTSLLAQTDSSIGGKTGVDFLQYKNMVGAFYMPKLVYMNISTLKTLPKRQFSSGTAELIKHGFIKDNSYTNLIRSHREAMISQNYETMEEIIYRSCLIKRDVVERDPKEQGERALLNFGHTIGHAIEKLSDFTLYHGECVSLGMVSAGYISLQKGNITQEQLEELKHILSGFGLPITLENFPHSPEDILATTKLDKKMESGKIKFVLLKTLGDAYITKELEDSDLLEGIRYIMGAIV
ncbi:3-dehydroquinate synthase [Lachnospiraceae bacterium 3-1]|nr:3-dehydroquinate synthase [Lachnospiraceae bacterium 3-1]